MRKREGENSKKIYLLGLYQEAHGAAKKEGSTCGEFLNRSMLRRKGGVGDTKGTGVFPPCKGKGGDLKRVPGGGGDDAISRRGGKGGDLEEKGREISRAENTGLIGFKRKGSCCERTCKYRAHSISTREERGFLNEREGA